MDIRQYVRAVAECLTEGARKGLTESWFLTRPGKQPQDLTTVGAAELLIWRLVESDMNKRAWLAVELLSPEINYCVQAIRDMQRVERYVKIGNEKLAGLSAKVTQFGEITRPAGPLPTTRPAGRLS